MANRPANWNRMSGEDKALWEYLNAGEEYTQGGAAEFDVGDELDYQTMDPNQLARLQRSGMSEISTDPALRDAEFDALRQLEEQSNNGFTARDEADMAKMRSDVNRTHSGRVGAIKQNMAERGMSGSGMDLVAQMQAEQDATEREALASLEQNAQMMDRKNQATIQRGNMAGNMRSRDFGEQAAKAEAQDAINRFNTANMVNTQNQNNQGLNQTTQANWGRTNQTADNNVTSKAQFAKDRLDVTQNGAMAQYNKATEDYNRAQAKKARKANRTQNMFNGAMQGAAAGSSLGPWGMAAGAATGIAANYAFGKVRGEAPFPGDDPRNDNYLAEISADEIVVPRTAAQDPETAAAFAAEAAGGSDPYEGIKNPQVREYMRQKLAAQKEMDIANETQKYTGLANAAGKIINDSFNNKREDAVLKNSFQNMGRKPDMVEANRPEWDGSAFDKMGSAGVKNAQGKMAQAGKDFDESIKFKGIEDADKLNDPASSESVQAREYLKTIAPGVAGKIAGFENLSAAQIQKTAPGLYKAHADTEDRKTKIIERDQSRNESRLNREAAKEDRNAYRQDQREYNELQKEKEVSEKKKGQVVEVEDRRRNIKDNLKILDDMIEENGTYEMFGSHNQDLERLVESIATDIAKLADPTSVARPSEVEQWKKTLVTPGFKNSNETARQVLKNFADEVDRRADNAYVVRGLDKPQDYKPTGKTTPQAPATSKKPAWAK